MIYKSANSFNFEPNTKWALAIQCYSCCEFSTNQSERKFFLNKFMQCCCCCYKKEEGEEEEEEGRKKKGGRRRRGRRHDFDKTSQWLCAMKLRLKSVKIGSCK